MKRIFLFLAVGALGLLSSCDGDTGPQGPAGPDSLVFEILNQDFTLNNGEYRIYDTFNNAIGGNLFDSETVLVYRLSGTLDAQTPIWQLIPRTLFLNDGNEVDYDFDFSKEDYAVYVRGTFDLAGSTYINDQTFRVVVLPGSFQTNKQAPKADFNDYDAVIKAYHINDSKLTPVK